MKQKILTVFSLLALTLASCSTSSKTYQVSDYRKTLTYHENFKILQLTDMHYSISTVISDTNAYVEKEIKEADPDLIVITGDTFMDASTSLVKTVLDFIDSFNIPFAFTYGNHDFQGNYGSDYIGQQVSKTKNAVYVDYSDDDIYGKANYFIDLMDGNSVKYRLFILDSNSYWQSGSFIGYDIIHEDQIKHIEDISSTYGKADSLAFYHIPVYEFADAYDLYKAGSVEGSGTNEEKCCVGYKRTDAFSRMKNCGVKGMFIGHDHINDTTLLYEDVVLSYGMKSMAEIYHHKIGYCVITLTSQAFSMADIQKVVIA